MNTDLHSQLVNACEMYVMLNNYNSAIEKLDIEKNDILQRYEKLKAEGIRIGGGIALVLVSSILCCTILMFLLIYLAYIDITPESNIPITLIRLFSPFLLIAVPFILVFTYKSIARKSKEKKRQEKLSKYYAEVFVPNRDRVFNAINGLEKEKSLFLQNNINLLDFVPEHYRTNLAVAFMERAVRTGRADTLKEAINLYEEQLHRWNMENYAQQLIDKQSIENEIMNEHLARIASNQGRIVSTLKNIENLEFYNTFCR